MMKYVLGLCLAFVVSPIAFAEDLPDAKAIEGNWMPVKAELGGEPMPDAVLKTISLKLAHGRYKAMAESPDYGTYSLDTATRPKSMTVTGTDGPNKGRTFPCIYELDGDTLRICYDLSGRKRPTEFKSVGDTNLFLVTYSRKK
jgi:uncharacterized protein (TIGR03067 family)